MPAGNPQPREGEKKPQKLLVSTGEEQPLPMTGSGSGPDNTGITFHLQVMFSDIAHVSNYLLGLQWPCEMNLCPCPIFS